MKTIALIIAIFAGQYTHAAIYNCNGTYTDRPCGNTPPMRITTSSGISPTATTQPPEKPEPIKTESTKKDEGPSTGSIDSPEPKFCKKLRAELKDARWRKANMIRQETIARAVEDEKMLVDEIWSKCSHRFE